MACAQFSGSFPPISAFHSIHEQNALPPLWLPSPTWPTAKLVRGSSFGQPSSCENWLSLDFLCWAPFCLPNPNSICGIRRCSPAFGSQQKNTAKQPSGEPKPNKKCHWIGIFAHLFEQEELYMCGGIISAPFAKQERGICESSPPAGRVIWCRKLSLI